MNIAEKFQILHTPKNVGQFEEYILRDCCAGDRLISENKGSFSFNPYVGCSNGCTYCYMKRDPYNKYIDNNFPKIKDILIDEEVGKKQIIAEVNSNLQRLRRYGLITSFVTDPFLPEVFSTTLFLIELCCQKEIPIKVLTKRADWVNKVKLEKRHYWKDYVSIGFTLTNMDRLEPNASPNVERINALLYINELGYNTFASIEPIINCEASYAAICKTFGKCDYYKIGIDSMRKYNSYEMRLFIDKLVLMYKDSTFGMRCCPTIFLKDNILDVAEIIEEDFTCYIESIIM